MTNIAIELLNAIPHEITDTKLSIDFLYINFCLIDEQREAIDNALTVMAMLGLIKLVREPAVGIVLQRTSRADGILFPEGLK